MMKQRIYRWLIEIARKFRPAPIPPDPEKIAMGQALMEAQAREDRYRQDYIERAMELVEARQMSGTGPWLVAEARERVNTPGARLRESDAISSQGAYGDIELALQNVEWRRQINLSWLEFSRWGIQQIILISRLYYLKNPICRRLVDVCAAYVFARGVEVTTSDETANKVLKEFFDRNKKTLGQNALVAHERSKDTDGNLFFVFFADRVAKGLTSVRTIDATEIVDIVCDPDDADTPWLYRREWEQRGFDEVNGVTAVTPLKAWYPALHHNPASKVQSINQIEVRWDEPVLHRKCGAVAKWHFGCPRIYPMLDWAREARKFLEACASVRQSLSQFAFSLTTKGGQQAIEGFKAQLSTTVGPSSQVWDQNPPAVSGGTFASGPGTKLEAFKTSGAGFSPEDVRQYKLMCCMVKGVPETFLADVSTGNLATATSLDRPTETMFLELQEAWREDLTEIAQFVLEVSNGATSGMLREAYHAQLVIETCPYIRENGKVVYEAMKPETGKVQIQVNFPAIREGDVPTLVTATCAAITSGGDIKTLVIKLYDLLGIENGIEIAEEQFPEATYDPDKTKEPATVDPVTGKPKPTAGQIAEAAARLNRALAILEANGDTQRASA